MEYNVNSTLGGTYVAGVISCWYHGFGFWASIVWPWYIGALFT